MCGDSTNPEDIALLTENITADCLFTDPPYNINVHNSQGMTIKNDLHPTMKPLKMCAELIRNSTKDGEIVLDLFGGSGSTLMVCEQLNRNYHTMEYDLSASALSRHPEMILRL